jgi:hypothetical protein
MVEIDAYRLAMLVNAAVVGLSLLLLWMAYAWLRKRRDYRAMRVLAQRVRDSATQRKQALREQLRAAAGLDEAALEKSVAEVDQAERQLYRTFIECYLKRNARAAADYDSWVVEFSAQYRALLPRGGQPTALVSDVAGEAGEAAETVAPKDVEPSESVAALHAQIDELQYKLGVAYETIDRMLKEYSQLYAGGQSDEQADLEAAKLVADGKANAARG